MPNEPEAGRHWPGTAALRLLGPLCIRLAVETENISELCPSARSALLSQKPGVCLQGTMTIPRKSLARELRVQTQVQLTALLAILSEMRLAVGLDLPRKASPVHH